MANQIKRFSGDETGAVSVEYALIAIIVGVGIIAALEPIRDTLDGYLRSLSSNF